VALFAVLVGAVCFNYGAVFLMPAGYIGNRTLAVHQGAKFFIAGGISFAIHALAVVKAYLL
jgi:hypothetical protein